MTTVTVTQPGVVFVGSGVVTQIRAEEPLPNLPPHGPMIRIADTADATDRQGSLTDPITPIFVHDYAIGALLHGSNPPAPPRFTLSTYAIPFERGLSVLSLPPGITLALDYTAT
jgi:hypothetical protein